MNARDLEDSDERKLNKLDHDRLVALEERVRQWTRSTDRRIAGLHSLLMWLIGALGSGAVAIAVKLLAVPGT